MSLVRWHNVAIGFGLLVAISTGVHAASRTAADTAWINQCVVGRKDERLAGEPKPRSTLAQLRKYCACMHKVVEDNQPFGISELERTYPPAHEMCWRRFRLSRPPVVHPARKTERWRLCGSSRTMEVTPEQAAQRSGTPRCVPLR